MMKQLTLWLAVLAVFSFANAQSINIAGSSTVYPISLGVAEEFAIEFPEYEVSVASTGTGGGFKKFCAGETDINDASRPVKQKEIDDCAANGIEMVELKVAWDALTVAVNPEADWVDCMSIDQLRSLWEPDSPVQFWSDLDPEWPLEELTLFGPTNESGTFDYFTEVVTEENGASRTDYFASEDDALLAENVAKNVSAMVYMGYAYYIHESDKLKAVAINNGETCVEPSTENIENGSYTPLSRPLFIYVSKNALADNEAVRAFTEFYLDSDTREIIAETGYALLADEEYEAGLASLDE